MAGKSGKKNKKAAKAPKKSTERKELVIRKRAELAEIEKGMKLPAEIKEEAKAEVKPVVAAEVKPAAKAEPKPAPKKETKAEPETAVQAEPKKAEKKTEAKPKAKEALKKMVVENYFEINNEQVMAEKVCEKIQEAYEAAGNKTSAIKTLKVYYNFGERRAYYVINGEPGGYVEF